eukprot:scaffold130717_cov66-Phaeocystis_antarctica.AAC.5
MKKPFTVPGSLSHLPALPKPHGFIYPPDPRSPPPTACARASLLTASSHSTDPHSPHTIARTSRTEAPHTYLHLPTPRQPCTAGRAQTHAPAVLTSLRVSGSSESGRCLTAKLGHGRHHRDTAHAPADLSSLRVVGSPAIGASTITTRTTAACHRRVAAQECGQPLVRLTRVGHEYRLARRTG